MKVSFDGLRKNIAFDYNDVVDMVNQFEDLSPDAERVLNNLRKSLNILRGSIGGLLACYDSEQMPDDFNDLSEQVELLELWLNS